MLVSSTLGWYEGPWIATVALGEARPQSTIARATSEEIERSLDETAIDIVILHNYPEGPPRPVEHHPLLQGYVRGSPSWRFCARAGHYLEAYCRILPPRFPRKPLRIDLRSRIGYEVEER